MARFVRPVSGSVVDRLLLGFLVVDGFAIGLLSVAFTYQRFGGVAVPVAALAAGVVNAALLWLAAGLTATPWRYGPLAAWGLIVVIAGGLPGPGGDVVLSISSGYLVQTLLLVVLGVGPCAALSWTGRLPEPD
ncbi:facilitated glucose transporter [Gordonia hongkongensis]|uniref:facilitated glucose transporter n=1 Tax=Gordonia hongkongensis TaxID=1701090 RepID=UPI003EC12807